MFKTTIQLLFASILIAPSGIGQPRDCHAQQGDREPQEVIESQSESRLDSTGDEFFEEKIRPLLINHCFECHEGSESESGLRLDWRGGLIHGGIRGPAIVVSNPDESLLIRAVRHGETLKMPPKDKLSTQEIADLARWISIGAPWPNSEVAPSEETTTDNGNADYDRLLDEHWSFQPLQRPMIPTIESEWIESPIDAFILAALQKQGLQPVEQADRATLIRRAYHDLLGLPPTRSEIAKHLGDSRDGYHSRMIDQLLASPSHGERWGRHWLDLARYADSNGLDENLAYATAFRYRDYVIDSFNRGVKFDDFVREQIAGDILAAESTDHSYASKQITATGFLCVGAKMLAEDDPVKMQMDIIDEQIDTIGKVFLGMTFGCARCHDHKFDPIPTRDYYALAGTLKSTVTMDHHNVVAQWQEREVETAEQRQARVDLEKRIEELEANIASTIRSEKSNVATEAQEFLADYLVAAWTQRRIEDWQSNAVAIEVDSIDAQRIPHLVIEAEEYSRSDAVTDSSGYGKEIGVLLSNRGGLNQAEFDIDLPELGTYQIDVRYAAETNRACRLIIDQSLISDRFAGGTTGGWYPDAQTWEPIAMVRLSKGQHVIRIESDSHFPHIDKFRLTKVDKEYHIDLTIHPDSYRPLPSFVQGCEQVLERLVKDDLTQVERAIAERFVFRDLLSNDLSVEECRVIAARIQGDLTQALIAPREDGTDEMDFGTDLKEWWQSDLSPFAAKFLRESELGKDFLASMVPKRAELSDLVESIPAKPTAMAVSESEPTDLRVHLRGDHLTLGDEVQRGVPSLLSRATRFHIGEKHRDSDGSRRLELADWIVDPNNPITARVIANRIWHWHFGQGLVRSPSNFGALGESPSHPELLDWLAIELVESDWDIKHLQRLILNSATWRLGSFAEPNAADVDPANIWLSHRTPRRRDAESVRDSMLRICGELDETMGGSLLPTANRAYVPMTGNNNSGFYDSNRRTVYLPVIRSATFEMLTAFDFPDASVSTATRQQTTVASQALFLLNSGFSLECSRHLARELCVSFATDAERVEELWWRCYGRAPDASEVGAALEALESFKSQRQVDGDTFEACWYRLCRAVFASNEFLFID